MDDSILQDEKRCLVCCSTQNVECHHVYFGTANRKISERHGFKVWLCNHHHTGGKNSVHRNRNFDLTLKKAMQAVYELDHTREEFIALIGRNYL